MRKVKRKESGFTRFARRLLMFTFALFALGIVGLNAYESEINIDVQKHVMKLLLLKQILMDLI